MTRGTSQRAPCALQDSHSRSQWRPANLKWDLIQFDNPFWNRWGSEPRNRNNLMAEDGDTTWCFSVPFVMCEINPVELVWFMSRWYKSFLFFFCKWQSGSSLHLHLLLQDFLQLGHWSGPARLRKPDAACDQCGRNPGYSRSVVCWTVATTM